MQRAHRKPLLKSIDVHAPVVRDRSEAGGVPDEADVGDGAAGLEGADEGAGAAQVEDVGGRVGPRGHETAARGHGQAAGQARGGGRAGPGQMLHRVAQSGGERGGQNVE